MWTMQYSLAYKHTMQSHGCMVNKCRKCVSFYVLHPVCRKHRHVPPPQDGDGDPRPGNNLLQGDIPPQDDDPLPDGDPPPEDDPPQEDEWQREDNERAIELRLNNPYVENEEDPLLRQQRPPAVVQRGYCVLF